jgi:hypothetical protein
MFKWNLQCCPYRQKSVQNFPIQSGLKQKDALSPLLSNFGLEYTIRSIQENQEGLKLNKTHRLLAYADDINTVQENTEVLLDTSKEVGLEANPEKTMYINAMLSEGRTKA